MYCKDEPPTYIGNPNNIVVGDIELYFDEQKRVYWLPTGIGISSRQKALQIARRLNEEIKNDKA